MELRQWAPVSVRLAGGKRVEARIVEISRGTVFVTPEATYQRVRRVGGEIRPIFGFRVEDVFGRERSA
jgi:hypothetical protein